MSHHSYPDATSDYSEDPETITIEEPDLNTDHGYSSNPDKKKVKYFKCPKCPNVYRYHSPLKYHLSTKHGINPFKCVDCNTEFYRKRDLCDHILYYHSEQCTYCTKKFANDYFLKMHQKQIHREKVKPSTGNNSTNASYHVVQQRDGITTLQQDDFKVNIILYMPKVDMVVYRVYRVLRRD